MVLCHMATKGLQSLELRPTNGTLHGHIEMAVYLVTMEWLRTHPTQVFACLRQTGHGASALGRERPGRELQQQRDDANKQDDQTGAVSQTQEHPATGELDRKFFSANTGAVLTNRTSPQLQCHRSRRNTSAVSHQSSVHLPASPSVHLPVSPSCNDKVRNHITFFICIIFSNCTVSSRNSNHRI